MQAQQANTLSERWTARQAAIRAMRFAPVLGEKALWRYAQLQRRAKGAVTIQAKYGARFIDCRLEDRIPRTIHNFGVWEPNATALFESILRPGDVCVDIGANIGYYTLLAAKLVGESGCVVAIEASPAIFAQLHRNIEHNRAHSVRALNLAASDEAGEVDIFSGPQSNRGLTSTLPTEGLSHEARVRAAPLDDVLTADELARVALIKIDIEGAEAPVLRRLAETIALYPAKLQIIAELNPQSPNRALLDEALAALRNAGFEAYAVENKYQLIDYLRWRALCPLQPLDAVPDTQCDVLFRRPVLA
ncbi:MAG: FkbM family methyltransferase [Pseudomonadota bacterium]